MADPPRLPVADWSVDQVVWEFCVNDTPDFRPIPNKESLEPILRTNHVDGSLLLELQYEDLKDELNIASLGQRKAFEKAVRVLRGEMRPSTTPAPLSLIEKVEAYRSGIPPGIPTPDFSRRSPYPQSTAWESTYGGNKAPNETPFKEHSPIPAQPSRYHLPGPSKGPDTTKAVVRPGQNSANSIGASIADPTSSPVVVSATAAPQQDSVSVNVGSQDNENNIHFKKEPDLLDTLDSNIDRTLRSGTTEISTDNEPKINKPSHVGDVQTVQPLTKPKRRIQPILIGPVQAKAGSADAIESLLYLPRKLLSLQESFFGEVTDDAEDDNFCFGNPVTPAGKSLVIARRISYFFRQQPKPVPGLSYQATYKLSFSPTLCAGPTSQAHFTLFAPNAEPSTQRLADWPDIERTLTSVKVFKKHVRPDTIVTVRQKNPFVQLTEGLPSQDASAAPDLGDFAYLLDKYPPTAEEDYGLPLYGDSGDENDFDEDTWQEIETEQQEKDTKISGLTLEEIKVAIDSACEAIREKWRQHKFAKAQSKAYKMWMKVAKAKRRSVEIDAYYGQRSHKNATLSKMRQFMLKDTWNSIEEVTKQCVSLEETIFQIMEAEYMLEVLHHNDPPEKPPPQSTVRKPRTFKPVEKDGEETLESESDFVVNDDRDAAIDDPTDEDFNLNLSEHSTKRVDKSTANDSPIRHDVDVSMTEPPTLDSVDQPRTLDPNADHGTDTQLLEDSDIVLPDVAAENSPINDDADVESDGEDEQILPRRKKSQSVRPAFTREDWSPSPKSSPPLPPSLPSHVVQKRQGSDSENSDLDAEPRLPDTTYKYLGTNKESAIELLSSDPARHEDDSPSGFDSVTTPPLNPRRSASDDSDAPMAMRKSKVRFQSTKPTIKQESKPTTEEDHDLAERVSAVEDALSTIRNDSPEQILLMVSALSEHPIFRFKDLGELLSEGLKAMKFSVYHLKGLTKLQTKTAKTLTKLFISFVRKTNVLHEHNSESQQDVNETFNRRADFHKEFRTNLCQSLEFFDAENLPNKDQTGKRPQSKGGKKRKHNEISTSEGRSTSPDDSDLIDLLSSDDKLQPLTPHKKRKKMVAESQEAKTVQKDDQTRIKEQQMRRQLLADKMEGIQSNSSAQVMVNSVEPAVWLDAHIASRIKPHQIDGIQFLWREIVEDPRHQGCLLAHTMGLGKTMQVISLIVSMAQSSVSEHPAISSQLIPRLRQNKTLILCPPTLLENWYDELLMWIPPQAASVVGAIYKISGRSDKSDASIAQWAESGGVLIVGYETLRSLLVPPEDKLQLREKVSQYEQWLLHTPSLVVADEAHKLKNAKSTITKVAQRFRTKSRIALTGSPLNNHLEEYHTMVEWIAPNYLGDLAQFRSKYVDPITAGLYLDSSSYERRLCLRKLHTLKKDINPKVNRADITAIRKDMPPKTEYIITIPLTDIQRQAYDTYVMHVLKQIEASGSKSRGLFKWMNDLQVLIAHPSCFMKVYERHCEERNEAVGKSDISSDLDDQSEHEIREKLNDFSQDPLEAIVSQKDLEAEEAVARVFQNQMLFNTIDDPDLSYRALLTKDIIEKAIACGDKTLVFSHSIPTLNFLDSMLRDIDPKLSKIDGSTRPGDRQKITKDFNDSEEKKVILLSTQAAGLGLNLYGANRVILFDASFNPMWEEQAVGRAYRLGQLTDVFVYRFKCGGTFEEPVYNKALYKTQLFQRVVDKKNPTRATAKSVSEYLFPVKDVDEQDFHEYIGRDPNVLDKVIKKYSTFGMIRNLELTETFQRDDGEELNADELKAADEEQEDEHLRREEPEKWKLKHGLARPIQPTGSQPAGTAPGARNTPKVKLQASNRGLIQKIAGIKNGSPSPLMDVTRGLGNAQLHASPNTRFQLPDQHYRHENADLSKVVAKKATPDAIQISDDDAEGSGTPKGKAGGCANQ